MDSEEQRKTQAVVGRSLRLRDDILKFVNQQIKSISDEDFDFAEAVAIGNIALSQALLIALMTTLVKGDETADQLREVRNEALVEAVQLLRGSRVGKSDEPE